MMVLVIFAFLAGIVTILSPCILPILPIVLATAVSDPANKHKPLGVVVGFIASFTFFTLFLASLVRILGVSASALRTLSVVVIGVMGLTLIVPLAQVGIEWLFTKMTNKVPKVEHTKGFGGGVLIGLSLGLLWTPCVGPILASVIALAITGTVTWSAVAITLSYAAGTAIPMLLIIRLGNTLFVRVPWLLKNTRLIQKVFGVLMIIVAIGIYLGWDRSFQTYILDKFPRYGTNLTRIEDNQLVAEQLLVKPTPKAKLASKGYLAPEFMVGGEWFNSDPLTLKGLRGKVVLIDFWTYTCINCQRTLPYLRKWDEEYRDAGLVIVGVHAPEFEFEKSATNVRQAIEDFALRYPVMQDNNFATWRAYDNHYWPAKYLIDKDGNVRYSHFGEGKYDETEAAIQELLKESGSEVNVEINNPEYDILARTPETYLGYVRMEGLSSLESVQRDKVGSYSHPNRLGSNEWSLGGEWLITGEYAESKNNASLEYRFNAKNVYLVLKKMGKSGEVKVSLDGKEVRTIEVSGDSLYTLIELSEPGSHLLRLEFDADIQAYAFTFG